MTQFLYHLVPRASWEECKSTGTAYFPPTYSQVSPPSAAPHASHGAGAARFCVGPSLLTDRYRAPAAGRLHPPDRRPSAAADSGQPFLQGSRGGLDCAAAGCRKTHFRGAGWAGAMLAGGYCKHSKSPSHALCVLTLPEECRGKWMPPPFSFPLTGQVRAGSTCGKHTILWPAERGQGGAAVPAPLRHNRLWIRGGGAGCATGGGRRFPCDRRALRGASG